MVRYICVIEHSPHVLDLDRHATYLDLVTVFVLNQCLIRGPFLLLRALFIFLFLPELPHHSCGHSLSGVEVKIFDLLLTQQSLAAFLLVDAPLQVVLYLQQLVELLNLLIVQHGLIERVQLL